MKMKLILFLCLLGLIIPFKANAASLENFKTLGLSEALKEEGIELKNKDYKETKDQAIIYMFRGQGCGYCKKFLTFLSSISKEYGKYFKLVSFEVWYDSTNANLMQKVPKITNVPAQGVPYIIIGDKVFDGYAESYDSQIKDAIKKQYNDKSYDVFDELIKLGVDLESIEETDDEEGEDGSDTTTYGNTSNNSGISDTFAIVFWNFMFVALGTGAIIYFSIRNKKEILRKIDDNNKIKKQDYSYFLF